MTTYHVKNTGHLDKAFKVHGGFAVVLAGKDGDVTTAQPLTDDQIEALAADGVEVRERAEKKAKDDDADKAKSAAEPNKA